MKSRSAKVGDVVRIIECRPLSRLKRWKLGTVLRRAVQVAVDHPAFGGCGRHARQEDGQKEIAHAPDLGR